MTGMTSVPPTPLKNRRQALRDQRRLKAWQAIWRFWVLSSLAGGLLWILIQPQWVIRDRSQIQVEGNKLLSKDQIRQLLTLSSAQPIWQLPIQQLNQQLQASPPIAESQITRQLLPPRLTMTVQERQPVAIAFSDKNSGYLDAEGVWIPQTFYRQTPPTLKLSSLKVIAFENAYRSSWKTLYPLIRQSSVKIFEVNWRNPNNLVLKTELGTVYWGSSSTQLAEKFKTLAQLRSLPSRVSLSRIIYIDLANPSNPVLQVKPLPTKPVPSKTAAIVRNQ